MAIEKLPAVNNTFGALQSQNSVSVESGVRKFTDPNPPTISWLKHTSRREHRSNNSPDSGGFRNESYYRRFVAKFTRAQSSIHPNRFLKQNTWRIPFQGANGAALASYFPGFWNSVTACDKDENLLNECVTRALLKIADGKATIGTSLAESKKTFGHLSETSIQLLTAYRHARRGRWTAVGDSLGLTKRQVLSGRFPANRWLEYQYGWKPLLNDIDSIYGVLQGSLKNDNFYLKGRASQSRRGSLSGTTVDDGITMLKSSQAEQTCTVRLVGKLDSPRWRQASQLGLINPLAVAWEVVPFSFLLDWFMPVGNVLEALTARAGLSFVTGGQTFCTGGSTSYEGMSSNKGHSRLSHLEFKIFEHSRIPYYYWPKPMVYVRDSPFSTTRSLSALALWRTSIKER